MDLITYSLIYGNIFGLASGLFFGKKNSPTAGTTTLTPLSRTVSSNLTAANLTHTLQTTVTPLHDEEFDPVKAEAGTIAGVVFGVLVSAILLAVAGIIYIRRKRELDREFMRKATVHRMSKESAGVYTDTTVDTQFLASEKKSGEYRSLRKNPAMCDDDSEDEL